MNEEIIFYFLLAKIQNPIGVCALMGNLYVESHLDPGLLESSKARKMGITAKAYSDKVNSGEMDRESFCHDGAGFGLAQWTYWSRKAGLYDYAKATGRGIGHLQMQLEYLWNEIQGYKGVVEALKEATDIRTASDVVCLKYEKPAHTEEKYLENRANYGRKIYDRITNYYAKEADPLNSANYVDEQIKIIKNKGIPNSEKAWELAKLCIGWAYVFGAYGDYCDPSNRRSRARSDHPTIQSRCKNFKGKDTVPAGCVGCKWFVGNDKSDESKHEGRTRFFDCRGFVYFVLHRLFGFWSSCPAGATSMWNNAANWATKGLVKDGVPKDTLVCLFYPDSENPKKMAHIGFGFNGETVECSSGVEHHTKYDKKWTHWAVPKCVTDGEIPLDPPATGTPIITYPTIRQGDRGEVVSQLQSFLAQDGSSLQIDGIFGSGTASAVRAFQKRYGLVVDGIVGPKTWTKLLEVAGNIKVDPPAKPELVNLLIPDIEKTKAEELMKQYPRAEIVNGLG